MRTLFTVIPTLYYLPTLIAEERKIKGVNSLRLINLLFGWTFIGWFWSLSLSLTPRVKGEKGVVDFIQPILMILGGVQMFAENIPEDFFKNLFNQKMNPKPPRVRKVKVLRRRKK